MVRVCSYTRLKKSMKTINESALTQYKFITTLMRLLTLKRLVVSFALVVGATVLYMITSEQMKCSELNFPQRCLSYSVNEITNDKVAQEASRNASPISSAADPAQRELGGWENPVSESVLAQEERFVLILIISAPFNTIRRLAIRQTWLSILADNSFALDRPNIGAMKDPTNSSNTLLIQYFFVCGHYYPRVESAVVNETEVYGDILRLRYTEKYSLLVHKTLTSLKLASTMNVEFVVKIDDDVYLDVPRMVWFLKTASLPEKLYAGHLIYRGKIIRRKLSKWYVSYQDYNETAVFPVYCNGPFYILSKNIVLEFLTASNHTRTFPLEDAYLGVLANKVGIVPTKLRKSGVIILFNFRLKAESEWEDSKLTKYFALGHRLTPERFFAFHKRYVNMTVSYL